MARTLGTAKPNNRKGQLQTVTDPKKRVPLHSFSQKRSTTDLGIDISTRDAQKKLVKYFRDKKAVVKLHGIESRRMKFCEATRSRGNAAEESEKLFIGWSKGGSLLTIRATIDVNSEAELLSGWYSLKRHLRELDKKIAEYFRLKGHCMYCGKKIPAVDIYDANCLRGRAARSDRKYCPPLPGKKSQPCKSKYNQALKSDLASTGREGKILAIYKRILKRASSE